MTQNTSETGIRRHGRTARMSQIVLNSGVAYFAGQIPDDCKASIGAQTTEVLGKIDALLAEIGSTKADLLSVQIWLNDITDFAGMNEVWDRWVDTTNPPARATCGAALARPGAKLEILVTAVARQ